MLQLKFYEINWIIYIQFTNTIYNKVAFDISPFCERECDLLSIKYTKILKSRPSFTVHFAIDSGETSRGANLFHWIFCVKVVFQNLYLWLE